MGWVIAQRASALGTAEFEVELGAIVDSVFRTAHRLTGNRQDAEDLVQEAALSAFRPRVPAQTSGAERSAATRAMAAAGSAC